MSGILRTTIISLGVAISIAAPAITVYSPDTFQSGTLSGWSGSTSGSTAPSNVSTGGPSGTGDRYLRVKSTGGSGAGSHLSMHNETQWSGNYIAAKVSSIEMDVKNEGSSTIKWRVAIEGASGARFVSTVPVTITPGSGWQHISFPINAASMTLTQGAGTFDDCVNSAIRIWFRHSDTPSNGGTAITAQLGVDNVWAIAGTTIFPNWHLFGPGNQIGGSLNDLFNSDNAVLIGQVNPAAEETGDPITLSVTAISPVATPLAIDAIVECRGEIVDIVQYVDLYDWTANQYVRIGTSSTTTTDTHRAYRATGLMSRFVKTGTKEISAILHFNVPASEIDLPYKVWIDRLNIQVTTL